MLWAALCATDPHGFPSAIHAQAAVLAASYLHLAKSLPQSGELVVLVGAGDTAQHADADRVCLAVALQQFAMLGASPLSQKLSITGLHQDMIFQGALHAVLAQVGLAQGGLADQAGLHGWLGLLKAEITPDHLILLARIFPLLFALHFTLFLLLMSGSIQKLLHYAAELDVGLQLHSGVCLGVAQWAAERALPAMLVAMRLLDALLAEAVTTTQGHGVAVNAQADGTGQVLLQSGHSTRLGHGTLAEGGQWWEEKQKVVVARHLSLTLQAGSCCLLPLAREGHPSPPPSCLHLICHAHRSHWPLQDVAHAGNSGAGSLAAARGSGRIVHPCLNREGSSQEMEPLASVYTLCNFSLSQSSCRYFLR